MDQTTLLMHEVIRLVIKNTRYTYYQILMTLTNYCKYNDTYHMSRKQKDIYNTLLEYADKYIRDNNITLVDE